jgi:hypothetical protein
MLSVLCERVIHVIIIIHGGSDNTFVDGICEHRISNLWTLNYLWTLFVDAARFRNHFWADPVGNHK